ncbi:hypothetical protein INR49_013847 [Caranx melampygus]|nr:hypothetical protein INR49_013847 [Caranx melampygus]
MQGETSSVRGVEVIDVVRVAGGVCSSFVTASSLIRTLIASHHGFVMDMASSNGGVSHQCSPPP